MAVSPAFLPCYSEGKIGVSVLGMLADVNDLVRLLRRIAVTVAGAVILAMGPGGTA